MKLYRGGELANEDRPELETADILVDGSSIVEIGPNLDAPDAAEIVDCADKIILPSFFDLHVHANEAGFVEASRAAIRGGVTGMMLMPDGIDSGDAARSLLEKTRDCEIEVFTAGNLTKNGEGEEMAGIAGLHRAGVTMLTDSPAPVDNPQLLRRAMEYAKNFDFTIASHCETPKLSGSGVMNDGRISYQLGLPGLPAISEEICLDRDIRLAQNTGTRLHIQQVSTARSLEAIQRAKADGLPVTCEVTPHHLLFTEADIGDYDTRFKTNPPLRTEADREALLAGLIAGDIDVIATAHSPSTDFEIETDFESAPFGVSGLETAVVALFHHLIEPGKMSWDVLARSFAAAPRGFLEIEGGRLEKGGSADFVLFDPKGKTAFPSESRWTNSPFFGKELNGQISTVIYRGEKRWNTSTHTP